MAVGIGVAVGGGSGVAVGMGVAVGGGGGVAVGMGVAVGGGSGVDVGIGVAGGVRDNANALVGGGGGKGVEVGGKAGADRSRGEGGLGCRDFSASPPGNLGSETPDWEPRVCCDDSTSRISTAGGTGAEAGTPMGKSANLGKPGVGAAAGRQLATTRAPIRAIHRPRIRMLLRPMPNRCNKAVEAPTAKAEKPS